ncbi:hypothetical protein ACFX19_044996 [Malus domestica]
MEPKAWGKNCNCRPKRLTQSIVVSVATYRIPANFLEMVTEITTFPVDLTKTRLQLCLQEYCSPIRFEQMR